MNQPFSPPAPNNPGAWTVLTKYLKILRVSLIERMAYRADFMVVTLFRFLPLLTTFLLWEAVYAGSTHDSIAGFSRDQMVAYLLLVQISRMFSSMPGLAGGITRDIRDGNLKKYLLQPIDMIAYLLSYRAAHKISYIISVLIPYGILFAWFHASITLPTHAITWVAYLASLLMSFLIGFFFETCMGMVGFWLLEVTSLLYIVGTLNFVLSGHMFPLDLFPDYVVRVLTFFPFHYLAYYPAMVFLEMKQGSELAIGLGVQAGWALGLIVLSRWLYNRGLRSYSAYGG